MLEDRIIRVLIVDDHAMVAESIGRLLEDEADIEVVGSVGSVGDVERSLYETGPDVVVMDYELGDGTGVEATRIIKARRPETKVVMLTGYTDEAILLDGIEAGCSGFITKHQGSPEIVNAIHAAAAGEAVIAPTLLARLLPRIGKDVDADAPDLTHRELEVIELLAQGVSTQGIADRLVLSVHTVRNHIQSLLPKFGVHSKLEAVAAAARMGIIRYPAPSSRKVDRG